MNTVIYIYVDENVCISIAFSWKICGDGVYNNMCNLILECNHSYNIVGGGGWGSEVFSPLLSYIK